MGSRHGRLRRMRWVCCAGEGGMSLLKGGVEGAIVFRWGFRGRWFAFAQWRIPNQLVSLRVWSTAVPG